MARQPFFGRGAGPQIARMNLNAATAPGRAYGQAFANLGGQIGKTIEQYQLNKEKRAKLTGEIEAMLPNYLQDLTMSGDEDADKKNMLRIEKFRKGDSSMADLQGLAGELAMKDKVQAREDARVTSALNRKILEQEFTSKQELEKLKKENKQREEKAYDSLVRRGKEIKNMVQNNQVEYDNLNPLSKRLFNDLPLIESRQVSVDKYLYSTDEEAKAELDRLDIENKNLEIQETKKSATIKPEFPDKESALTSISSLPEGVSADVKKFKDGFNVEYRYKAKEFTDIPSVPGYPNYKIVGGYVYEADPKTKKLTKLGSENFGEKSELLQKTIESLTTKDLDQYSLAKFRGDQNDDGDYEVQDPASGETIVIPFNQDLENKLIYLDGLRNKLKTQLDIDLDLTTR
tara:strand:+ start:1 stop:1206 length:1206 start_codon:yes stop_codon:yes gene_type:complete